MNGKRTSIATGAAALALVLTLSACGVGTPTAEGQVSESADTFLRALADDRPGAACRQIWPPSVSGPQSPCPTAMRHFAGQVGRQTLATFADQGAEISIDGRTATATFRRSGALQLTLHLTRDRWLVDARPID